MTARHEKEIEADDRERSAWFRGYCRAWRYAAWLRLFNPRAACVEINRNRNPQFDGWVVSWREVLP